MNWLGASMQGFDEGTCSGRSILMTIGLGLG